MPCHFNNLPKSLILDKISRKRLGGELAFHLTLGLSEVFWNEVEEKFGEMASRAISRISLVIRG